MAQDSIGFYFIFCGNSTRDVSWYLFHWEHFIYYLLILLLCFDLWALPGK